jgi:uncharacterized FlgJ-related protein
MRITITMPQKSSAWLLAAALIAYALCCLILVLALSHNPLGGRIDSDLLTSNTLLPDLSAVDQPMERVELFIGILRPLIEQKNALLLNTRSRLQEIKHDVDQKLVLGYSDREQLERWREEFGVSADDYPSDKQALEVL